MGNDYQIEVKKDNKGWKKFEFEAFLLGFNRKEFKVLLHEKQIRITTHGVSLNDEQILQLWLNPDKVVAEGHLNKRLTFLETEFEKSQKKLELQKSEYSDLKKELEIQNSENSDLKKELEIQKSEYRDLKKELEIQNSEYRDLKRKVTHEGSKEDWVKSQEILQSLEQQIKQQENDQQILKQKLDNHKTLVQEFNSQKAEQEGLKQELAEQKNSILTRLEDLIHKIEKIHFFEWTLKKLWQDNSKRIMELDRKLDKAKIKEVMDELKIIINTQSDSFLSERYFKLVTKWHLFEENPNYSKEEKTNNKISTSLELKTILKQLKKGNE